MAVKFAIVLLIAVLIQKGKTSIEGCSGPGNFASVANSCGCKNVGNNFNANSCNCASGIGSGNTISPGINILVLCNTISARVCQDQCQQSVGCMVTVPADANKLGILSVFKRLNFGDRPELFQCCSKDSCDEAYKTCTKNAYQVACCPVFNTQTSSECK